MYFSVDVKIKFKKKDRKCNCNTTMQHVRIFVPRTLLEQTYHPIHCGKFARTNECHYYYWDPLSYFFA